MRRFELVEGTSSKFWEIALDGSLFTVRFGRIGTNGQTQEKRFPTPDKAKVEHDKLVAEKVKKGYAEVDGGSAPIPAAPKKEKPAKAAEPEPGPEPEPARQPEPEPGPEPKPPPSPPASPIVATDPSTWPAELRAELHPSRAWPGAPIALDRAAIWKKMRERAGQSKSPMSSRLALGEQRLASTTAPEAVGSDDAELAVARLLIEAANPYSETRWIESGVKLAVDHWVATAGIAEAIRLAARLLAIGLEMSGYAGRAIWGRVAMHVQAASDDAWQRARAVMEELAAASPSSGRSSLRTTFAYVFPESGEGDRIVLGTAAPSPYGYGDLDPYAVAAITSLDTLRAFVTKGSTYHLRTGSGSSTPSIEPTLYTFVARFGEDVIDPLLTLMEHEHTDTESTRALARAIGLVSTPRAFEVLAARAADKNVVMALREAALRTPEVALGALAQASSGRGAAAQAVRAILAQIVRTADLSAAEDALPDSQRRVIAELRAPGGADREEARADELPPVLAQPPWTVKKRRGEAPEIDGAVPSAYAESIAWRAGVREQWRSFTPHLYAADQWRQYLSHLASEAEIAGLERGDPAAIEALRTRRRNYTSVYGNPLVAMPLPLVRSVLLALAHEHFWEEQAPLKKLAAEHELAFLEPLLAYATHHPVEGLPILMPYDSPQIAPLAADALSRLRRAQSAARAWLLAHPEATAVGLVPIAVGKRGKERGAAEHALRFIAREGHEAKVMDVAARHGDAVKDAVRAILDFDPRDLFPTKMPKLPDFAVPAALPRPVLASGPAAGKTLPASAMEPLLLMMAISRPDAPYQGLLDVRDACTPSSMAQLSWELFQAWLVAGAPSKEGWAFTQLGMLGDDECARRLAPLVRVWPGEAAHQRAVTGLDVLAAIGTDVALMHLHGISQKLKFKGLQEKAREKIDSIAETRGLSAEELADRLVPDLGLDEQGSMILDFGTRSFRVGFDEALKPFVRDAEGARLSDLPKPRKDDDAEKAKAATDLWKALKKDVKTLASQQLWRLELAMCARRRWTGEVFRRFLVEHPLVRHVVVRLVWGLYDEEDALRSSFRVAEDGTFADANDDAWELPEDARVGVPHALELSVADAQRFGQTFGDYEILQPFRQLGRETYALTDDEKKADVVNRWSDHVVPTGAVLGLEARGWRRSQAQDGGVIHSFERDVRAGDESVTVSLEFEPGVIAGAATEWKEQKLLGIGIGVAWRWRKQTGARKLGDLHPITASEILRDVTSMATGDAG